jgi:hypothetical protein
MDRDDPRDRYGRMDETAWEEPDTARWRDRERWGHERSYSSGRAYGDRTYGGVVDPQPYRSSSDAFERRDDTPSVPFARQGYGGPYVRDRDVREWSSTEGWRVPGPHAGRGPRGYQRSDERIQEELHERLTAHGHIDATDIECRVSRGEVTLGGFVDSRGAKRAAGDLAEDIYGVRQVNNQLRVRSHADDEGVGRTSVLGLTESQVQRGLLPGEPGGRGRPRTRS